MSRKRDNLREASARGKTRIISLSARPRSKISNGVSGRDMREL
jgi:hypothetical protein